MCQECDTQRNCICSTFVAKTLCPRIAYKMDFQDQFIAIMNFGNISHTVLKKFNDFKIVEKKKAAAKEFVGDVGQIACALLPSNYIFTKLFSLSTERRHYN